MHSEIDELRKLNAELYAALLEVQWADGGLCPQCGMSQPSGHQPKCTLALALAAAAGKAEQ